MEKEQAKQDKQVVVEVSEDTKKELLQLLAAQLKIKRITVVFENQDK